MRSRPPPLPPFLAACGRGLGRGAASISSRFAWAASGRRRPVDRGQPGASSGPPGLPGRGGLGRFLEDGLRPALCSTSDFRRAYSGSRSFHMVSSGAAMKIEE